MNRKTKFVLLTCFAIICSIVAGVILIKTYYVDIHRISWQLHGTWITDYDEPQGKVQFNVTAWIIDYRNDQKFDVIYFEADLPEDFPYRFDFNDPYYSHDPYYSRPNYNLGPSYYTFFAFTSLGSNSHPLNSWISLDLEKCYLAMNIAEEQGPNLVASTDPNVPPNEIMDHFSE